MRVCEVCGFLEICGREGMVLEWRPFLKIQMAAKKKRIKKRIPGDALDSGRSSKKDLERERQRVLEEGRIKFRTNPKMGAGEGIALGIIQQRIGEIILKTAGENTSVAVSESLYSNFLILNNILKEYEDNCTESEDYPEDALEQCKNQLREIGKRFFESIFGKACPIDTTNFCEIILDEKEIAEIANKKEIAEIANKMDWGRALIKSIGERVCEVLARLGENSQEIFAKEDLVIIEKFKSQWDWRNDYAGNLQYSEFFVDELVRIINENANAIRENSYSF